MGFLVDRSSLPRAVLLAPPYCNLSLLLPVLPVTVDVGKKRYTEHDSIRTGITRSFWKFHKLEGTSIWPHLCDNRPTSEGSYLS